MKKNNKGFTLVELIVVLVILAILAAILVPTLLGYIERARSEKDYSTAQTVRVAAQAAIDQAYGDGVKCDTTSKVTAIGDMDQDGWAGAAADANSTDASKKYSKLVYTLSGVDTGKVTDFKFWYTDGIITKGWVKINGVFYKLEGGQWTSAGTTEPAFT